MVFRCCLVLVVFGYVGERYILYSFGRVVLFGGYIGIDFGIRLFGFKFRFVVY